MIWGTQYNICSHINKYSHHLHVCTGKTATKLQLGPNFLRKLPQYNCSLQRRTLDGRHYQRTVPVCPQVYVGNTWFILICYMNSNTIADETDGDFCKDKCYTSQYSCMFLLCCPNDKACVSTQCTNANEQMQLLIYYSESKTMNLK